MSLPTNRRILSGMRSTNPKLHIGNYEGALRNWVDLQNTGFDMFCMVADWHALTTMFENPQDVSVNAREVAKDYIAAGIDPAKSVVFVQSHVKEHAEFHLLLSMMTPLGWLERTPTYKEKVADLNKHNIESLLSAAGAIHTLANTFCDTVSGEFGRELPPYIQTHLIDISTNLSLSAKRVEICLASDIQEFGHEVERLASTVQPFRDLGEQIDCFDKPWDQFLNLHHELQGHLRPLREFQAASIPYGLLGYPVLQTADILLYRPHGVPVGRDQAPHLEIGNDIARRFNNLYNVEIFEPYKYMIPEDENRAKLPGLDMRKMSKSYDNCIYLSDSPDETAAKIKSAFTTPTKMRKTDPGIPEGCAVCQYLKLYSPDWERQWAEDVAGERGCMQSKQELTEVINEFFRPMRERRAALDDSTIEDILRDGAERARAVAAETMDSVRQAMGLR